jgi:hypothetical protein
MDDYSLVSLSDSRNEWCARLVNTLTPCIIEGLKSIFDEAWKLCVENEEEDKYLMTFQTFLSRIPKWNPEIIENERKRIEDTSSCGYLEELITCVHVIHLKALTCVRVGHHQKKVDIDIPSVDNFIHKVYCNVARKLYTSIYLFEKNLMPLEIQKHNRELEVIIRECILNTVRDTMPIENILKAYIDETEELDVNEEVVVIENEKKIEKDIPIEPVIAKVATDNIQPGDTVVKKQLITSELPAENIVTSPTVAPSISLKPLETASLTKPNVPITYTPKAISVLPQTLEALPVEHISTPPTAPLPLPRSKSNDTVNFKDEDSAVDINGLKSTIIAPKTDERLEEIANLSAERRRQEEEEEEEEDKLKIGDSIKLDIMDINDLNRPVSIETAPILNDIEVLS